MVWPLRVYYEDTDRGGIVYHANYLKFFERARTEWLRALGFTQEVLAEQQGILFVVHRIELNYQRAARLDDWLEVQTQVSAHGRASLLFDQSLYRAPDTKALCHAQIRVACVRHDTWRPQPIPAALLTQLMRQDAKEIRRE